MNILLLYALVTLITTHSCVIASDDESMGVSLFRTASQPDAQEKNNGQTIHDFLAQNNTDHSLQEVTNKFSTIALKSSGSKKKKAKVRIRNLPKGIGQRPAPERAKRVKEAIEADSASLVGYLVCQLKEGNKANKHILNTSFDMIFTMQDGKDYEDREKEKSHARMLEALYKTGAKPRKSQFKYQLNNNLLGGDFYLVDVHLKYCLKDAMELDTKELMQSFCVGLGFSESSDEKMLCNMAQTFKQRFGIDFKKVRDGENQTLVAAAARGGYQKLIQMFLNDGVGINEQDDYGDTALSQAVAADNFEMTQFLLQQGADGTIANKRGETPLATTQLFEKQELDHIRCMEKKTYLSDAEQDQVAIYRERIEENRKFIQLLQSYTTDSSDHDSDEKMASS